MVSVEEPLTFGRITALALADAVNPCAIAVLTIVLVTLLTHNPNKRKNVLFAGLAFVSSVYVGYMFYGAVLVNLFHSFAEVLRENSRYIYEGLAVVAMIIGGLNIKDYFVYKPGSIGTEMPLKMRPKMKKLVNKITSPTGAFVIGFLVTLFLLPCTIGPYVVASGSLSKLGFLGAVPWLLYYNLLFVLPMILITLIVYFGFAKVQDVSGWKERNIRKLHLVAGVLLFLVGLGILAGWI